MRKSALAGLALLAACGGSPKVFVANHAMSDRPTFEIEEGKARHIDIVTCADSTKILWQADAPSGDYLPATVVDSTTALPEGCYFVRIVPQHQRRFSVMPDHVLLQDL
ncbi:MAG TPA: hypothetical protein VEV39_08220 [Gemmatimonadales bacterium]|nr:hypothetical protein [Gemmatimonadales bacterium]